MTTAAKVLPIVLKCMTIVNPTTPVTRAPSIYHRIIV